MSQETMLLRAVADKIMAVAESRPKGSRSAEHLRAAAAALLDAESAIEEEGQ